METTKVNQGKKKMNDSSASKSRQQKIVKCDTDLSQSNSSNVGKGPAGENL